MSKQIYIDSNGNEIQVSGTVNTADMMPMSGNDSTKVSEAIGDLSQLTTSVTSSLVGAVNEVVSTKQNKITYHQETVTPDSSGSFNTGVTIDKLPLSCTTANGYISGFIYSGGYWYARIVNYAGQPVTTAVTVSTWYIDNPSQA